MSDICCTWVAGNAGPKISLKIRSLGTMAQICRAISSQLRHVSTIGKNLVKQQYLPHMVSMVNFGPLAAEIGWRVWGTTVNFNGFSSWLRYCSDVAQRRSTKLCTMFECLLVLVDWYTIYTFSRALVPNRIFPCSKFTLRPSLSFSYIGSVTARHSSSGHEPNFAALYKE